MLSLRSVILGCSLILQTVCSQSSSAGWGFPAYGAWAYGSGCGSYSFHSSYWGGYPRWSGASFYRTHYRGVGYSTWGHSLSRIRSCYPRSTWYSTTFSYPFVRTSFYYPSPYVASINCAPVTWAPSFYYFQPTYYQPIDDCLPSYTWPNCSVLPDHSVNYINPLGFYQSQPVVGSPVSLPTHSTFNAAGQPMAVDSSLSTQPMTGTIPPQLLAAADAILQAGGYRQAATAYAQLNVRYGSSNEIFTRRFVAQVASGDHNQAAVILASAQAAGFQLQASDLPNGQLAALLPGKSEEVTQLTEKLASEALSTSQPLESMQLMGAWLTLSGDDSRAALFLAMADRLSSEGQSVPVGDLQLVAEELPKPRSKSAYISLE